MLKHLSEEIPEQAHIGREIGHLQAERDHCWWKRLQTVMQNLVPRVSLLLVPWREREEERPWERG